jgi:hypothetical protein
MDIMCRGRVPYVDNNVICLTCCIPHAHEAFPGTWVLNHVQGQGLVSYVAACMLIIPVQGCEHFPIPLCIASQLMFRDPMCEPSLTHSLPGCCCTTCHTSPLSLHSSGPSWQRHGRARA